jgi:hypothetical protein
VLEGKCLKDGWRNGAEVSVPVRLAHRLRRAPVFGGVGLGCQPILFAAAASCRMQKARSGFSGAGLILATMKVYR